MTDEFITNMYKQHELYGLITAFPLTSVQLNTLKSKIIEYFKIYNTLTDVEKTQLIKKLDLSTIMKSHHNKTIKLYGGKFGRGSSSRSRGMSTGRGRVRSSGTQSAKTAKEQAKYVTQSAKTAKEQAKYDNRQKVQAKYDARQEERKADRARQSLQSILFRPKNIPPNITHDTLGAIIDADKNDNNLLVYNDNGNLVPQTRNPFMNDSVKYASFYNEPGGMFDATGFITDATSGRNVSTVNIEPVTVSVIDTKILAILYILTVLGMVRHFIM